MRTCQIRWLFHTEDQDHTHDIDLRETDLALT